MAALVGTVAGRLIASSAGRWRTRRLVSILASVQSVAVSIVETGSEFGGGHGRVSLKEMTYPELKRWVESNGHKASRADMLWRHLYGSGKWVRSPSVIPRMNKEFVSLLVERAEFAPMMELREVYTAKDGTKKLVFFVEEYGASVETVVIPGPRGRVTVCVSSQIGCAMNCQFCFTAKMGLRGNLSTAQIVEQLVVAARLCNEELGQVTNVVFMGMGEPLHNLESVIRAAEIMVSEKGLHLSPRKVTISTSGLVPQIRRFVRTSKCALAVSLNATTDEVRDRIMPINRKYNIRMLLDCVREELITYRPGEAAFIEYVMLKDVNDTEEDAARLVELVKDVLCKINLITFNSHPGSAFEPTPLEEVLKFRDRVADAGFVVHIRNSRGDDEKMACGQLGSVVPKPPRRRKQEIQLILIGDPVMFVHISVIIKSEIVMIIVQLIRAHVCAQLDCACCGFIPHPAFFRMMFIMETCVVQFLGRELCPNLVARSSRVEVRRGALTYLQNNKSHELVYSGVRSNEPRRTTHS